MANKIYDDIKAFVQIKDNVEFKSYDKLKQLLYVNRELGAALYDVYDSLRGEPLDQAELADALRMFFNEYVVPIDLPMNDFIEGAVEQQVAALIAPAVKALDAALDKKLPQGPDAE